MLERQLLQHLPDLFFVPSRGLVHCVRPLPCVTVVFGTSCRYSHSIPGTVILLHSPARLSPTLFLSLKADNELSLASVKTLNYRQF